MDGDEGPKPWRLFVALPLSTAVRRTLETLRAALRDLPSRVSWVRPENAHLTVKFLGDVAPSQVEALQGALDEVGARTAPFRIVLGEVGAFPPRGDVRTVWLGARDGTEAAGLLAERLDAALELRGFPRERRPFAPHVTLGRVRSPLARAAFMRVRDGFGELPPAEMSIERLILYRSELQPGVPPRYTALHEAVLGGVS